MKKIMQKIFLSSLLIGVTITTTNAQSVASDTISKMNGERIAVKIISVNEKDVVFSYPGESMTISLSKNQIKEIIYSSGRKEKVSDMVEINGENDWEKVVLTEKSADVEGLIKKGDLSESTKNMGLYTPLKKATEKLQTKIKKDAAKLGAHIVLVTPVAIFTSYTLSGIAYGYK